MKIFLIWVNDENFYRLLPEDLGGSKPGDPRVKVMGFPPLGIETLAPVLRQHGHQVRMFDTCHPEMKEPDIAQALRDDPPDVVALSFLSTTTYPGVKSMAQVVKSVVPDVPIICGGVFATMNQERILKDCPYIDAVGVGEGEELLPDYLDHLNNPASVAGLVWRDGDKIVKNIARPIIKDLNQFPYPDRTTLPIDYIESLPLDVPAVLSLEKFCTMQTSRGCPYTCIYCDIPALTNGKWRFRSPEHVLGEMQQLHDQGYRSIYLTDDHFLLKRDRISTICQNIIDHKLAFKWGCEGRVDSVAVDQLPIMGKANCNFLAFGVESGTQKSWTGSTSGRRSSKSKRRSVKPSGAASSGRTDFSWSVRPAKPRRTSWRASVSARGSSWTPSVSTGCVSIVARRCGTSISNAASSTTNATGPSGSSVRTLTRRCCPARSSIAHGKRATRCSLPAGFSSVPSRPSSCSIPWAGT